MVQPGINTVNPVWTRFSTVELVLCPYSETQGKNPHYGCFCVTELVLTVGNYKSQFLSTA